MVLKIRDEGRYLFESDVYVALNKENEVFFQGSESLR